MEAHPFDPAPAPACAPYRNPPPAPTPTSPPRSSRFATALTLVFAGLTLWVSLAILGLVRGALHMTSHRPSRSFVTSWRPESHLDTAVQELARRRHQPLYIAPDLDRRVAVRSIAAGSLDGSLPETLRALDAYAAVSGAWLHDVDGVLRLEREVTSVNLHCEGMLDACATRLERVASVTIVRPAALASWPIRLTAQRDVPAVECMRAALVASGLQVDVVGRTLYVTSSVAVTPHTDASRAIDAAAPSGIRALGRGRYALTRAAVDRMINGQSELMRSTRILPEMRDGRTVGVRVFGIRSGDVLAALGLENGDVLARVNGFDVVSPDRCLEAYASLRRTDRVTLELRRRGRPVALTYLIEAT